MFKFHSKNLEKKVQRKKFKFLLLMGQSESTDQHGATEETVGEKVLSVVTAPLATCCRWKNNSSLHILLMNAYYCLWKIKTVIFSSGAPNLTLFSSLLRTRLYVCGQHTSTGKGVGVAEFKERRATSMQCCIQRGFT